MAVVPDKMILIREKINLMNSNLKKITQFITEFENFNQEEEQRQFDLQTIFIKNDPILNDTFFSNSSPSSSNDSISSLVTEPSKKLHESSETNIRKLRSTNNRSIINNCTSIKEDSKFNLQKKRSFQDINMYFSLESNDLVDDIIKNSFSNIKQDDVKVNSQSKFKNDLNKILEKLEIFDINKLFKIELIKPSKVKELNKNDEIYSYLKAENNDKESFSDNKQYFDYDEILDDNQKTTIDVNIKYLKTATNLDELKSIKIKLKSEIDSDESKCNEEA